MNIEPVLNALPEPSLVVEGRTIIAANAAARAIFRNGSPAIEGHDFADLFDDPPTEVERHLALWRSTAQLLPAALSIRLPSGEPRKYRCSGARIAGTPVRVFVRLTEAQAASRRFLALNERLTKMAREARIIATEQHWLEALLNLMPTPMLQVEIGSGRIMFQNRAATAIAVPGQILPLRRIGSGEPFRNLELTWNDDGLVHYALLQAGVLPAMYGRPATAVVTFQDVTTLKRIEQELQQASRLKDEFLATVSHELRTPLNAIMGWTMMLRDTILDESGRKRALESIEKNARAQARVIEDLLDVSRIITGKLRLDLRPTPIAPAIEAALDSVRPTAAAKRLQLDVDLDSSNEPVLADAARVQQIVWNLLSNAVKFTPPGGRVSVSVRRKQGVEIVVSDTGPGIDPAFLPRVFERFTQADSGTARSHSGLGLGLAIARHLAELHGGTIDANSKGPGRGATFTVRLPDLPAPAPAQVPSSSSA